MTDAAAPTADGSAHWLSTKDGDDAAALGAREHATHTELARLDPRLASLSLFGHQLVQRVHKDADAVYLLAGATRSCCSTM